MGDGEPELWGFDSPLPEALSRAREGATTHLCPSPPTSRAFPSAPLLVRPAGISVTTRCLCPSAVTHPPPDT